jgi:hypothetical protein
MDNLSVARSISCELNFAEYLISVLAMLSCRCKAGASTNTMLQYCTGTTVEFHAEQAS